MTKKILIFFFIFFSLFTNAQSYSFQWAKSVAGGPNGGRIITTDVSGNVYVSGTFSGSVDFDPGPGSFILTSMGGGGCYVLKLDASGNFIWAIKLDYTVSTIKCNSAGDIIVAGYFNNMVDFDPGSGVYYMSGYATNGYTDMVISKISSVGNFLWAKQIGGNYIDKAVDLTLDASGNIYYTGIFGYGADFDSGPGTYTVSSYGGAGTHSDISLSKLDASGNLIWAKSMIGSYNLETSSIALDPSGNIYLTGTFDATLNFNPGVTNYTLSTAGINSEDIFICKFDNSGNFSWAKKTNGGSPYSNNQMVIDAAGNQYISGIFDGTIDFDPGPQAYNLASGVSPTGFIFKLNTLGSFVWAKKIDDAVESIALDASANLYATGGFTGTKDFDPNAGIYNLSSFGYSDVFVIRMDSASNLIWAKNLGGASYDGGAYISLDLSGNVYTTGQYTGPADFDNGGSTFNLTSSGNFIHKMSTCIPFQIPTSTTNASNQNICSANTTVLSVSTTASAYWYDSPSSGIVLAAGPTFTPPSLSAGNYTYYAEASDCAMINQRMPITLSVNATPTISVNSGTMCAGQTFSIMPSGANSYTFSGGSSVVMPSTTTSYTITGSNLNGCVNNIGAICSVTVNTTPSLTVVCSPSVICIGNLASLNVLGAPSIVHWSFQSGNLNGNAAVHVNPTVTTTYSVTAYNQNCPATKAFTVTVTPHYNLNISHSNDTICRGSSVTYTATGASLYYWNNNLDSNIYNIAPTNNTTYTVQGVDVNNCFSNTQTVAVTVNQNCQDVWPGDANSDGVADNFDVLELGLHFTQTGPARATTNNNWQSYFSNNWTGTLSNGKNLNHSDCNGDGTINSNDTLAIFNNYALTHAFKPVEQAVVNPQLSIVPDQNIVSKGNWGTSSVFLGEPSAPITGINGVAFTVAFDQNLIDVNSFYIEYPASFLNAGNQNLDFSKPDFTNGKLYTATTHTITNNVSGNGKIAVLHYKIKSNLVLDAILNIAILNTKQSNASGVLMPLTAGSATVAATSIVGMDELSNASSIGLYPNPANASVTIQSSTTLEKIELLGLTGQVILSEGASGTHHQLDLRNVANGVYFVVVSDTTQKVTRKKLVVQR